MSLKIQQAMEQHTTWLNWSAVGVAAVTILDYAPKIAALFSIIWLGIQIGTWAVKRARALIAWWKAR